MDTALIISAISFGLFVLTAITALSLSVSLKRRAKEVEMEKRLSARQLYELAILKELGDRTGYSLDVEEVLRIITGSLHQFIDYTAVAYVVIIGATVKLNVHFDKSAEHTFFLEMKKRMLDSLSALSGKSFDKVIIEEEVSGAIEIESGPNAIGSFFNIPLVISGKLAGVLTVAHTNKGLYKEEDMTIMYKITSQAAEAVTRLHKVVALEQERINKVREEYTSIIVHELRSPLDGIRKIIELIVSGKLREDAKVKEYASMAYQSSGRMLELIGDILDLSKLEAGKFEIHMSLSSPREAIENRLSFYKISSDMAKVGLGSNISSDLPATLSFDKEAIKQMLGNFLSNSIKFTSPGGSIIVSAFVFRPGKSLPEGFTKTEMPVLPKVTDIKATTSSMCVVVSDTGSGVDPKMLPNLFQPFIQAGNSSVGNGGKGTGLGLSIVKGMAEAHGGTVGAVSKDGFGSSFFFTIPI